MPPNEPLISKGADGGSEPPGSGLLKDTASRIASSAHTKLGWAVIAAWGLTVLFVLLASPASADGPGAGDAGPSPERSLALPEGTWNGSLIRNATVNDTADFYSYEFDSAHMVEAVVILKATSTHHQQLRLHVFDRSEAEVVNFTFGGLAAPTRFSALTNQAFPTLRYYLSLEWHGDATTPYNVSYNVTVLRLFRQNDAGTGRDVGNDTSRSEELSVGETVVGSVGGSSPQWAHDLNVDGADFYEVTPIANRFVVVEAKLDAMTPTRPEGFDLRIMDQAGKLLDTKAVLRVGDSASIKWFSATTVPFYVIVYSQAESCNYTLSVVDEAPPEIDLFIASIGVSPPKLTAGQSATISVQFKSTTAAVPPIPIECELYAGTDRIWNGQLLFDETGSASVDVTWVAIYGETVLTAHVDVDDAVPYESNEQNNAEPHTVVALDPGENGDGDGDGDGNGMDWIYIALLLVVVCAAIAVAVAYAALKGRSRQPEDEWSDADEGEKGD